MTLPLLLQAVLLFGCVEPNSEKPVSIATGSHFEIEGFQVFPLKTIHIGETAAKVRTKQGAPAKQLRDGFLKPNRVALSELPDFDEQWGYFENMGNRWIFFRDGKVVAAFREESDF